MTATLVGQFEAGSDDWHAARALGLGGSEISAVLDLSPWESRYALYQRKRGRIPRQDLNAQMEWGNRLEAAVLGKFTDEHPELSVQAAPGTYASDARPWQIANPDALVHGTEQMRCAPHAIVEVKTAHDDWDWGDPGTDQVPPYYLCQARHYLDVLDLDTCWLAVLIGGSDYREYVIRPDPDDTALLRAAGAQFIDDVRHGHAPDIDSSDATYKAVKQLPDGVIDGPVELDPQLAFRYLDALDAYKKAETEKRHATSLVLHAIGDRTRAECAGQRIATRSISKATGKTKSLMPARQSTTEEIPA